MVEWRKYWKCVVKFWCIEESAKPGKEYSVEQLLLNAREELANAHHLFSRVEDSDMIEYAVLMLKAAEIRHDYLLKRVKTGRTTDEISG